MLSMRDPAHVHQNRSSEKPGLVRATKGNGFSRHFAQASAEIGAIPQFETTRFETPKSDSPGLLLLDTFLRPTYVNDEAVSILSYPQALRGNGHGAYFLKQRIDSLLPQRNGSPDPKFSGELASGRRRYQVRVFAMKSNWQSHSGPTLAVLLERNREHADRLRAAQLFHLTQRETAALEFLMLGYTTKQIACRMDISPNTAKAFLRSIMFKSGASNGAGILAKVLQFERLQQGSDLLPRMLVMF